MSELTDRIKSQLEQANEAVEQVKTASRGLVVKAIDRSTKAFRELIELGEAQLEAEANGGDSLASQLSTGFRAQLEDLSASAEQVKVASIGLVIKTKAQGTKVFSDLIEAGNTEVVIEFSQGGTVRGRVTLPDGSPAANVMVNC